MGRTCGAGECHFVDLCGLAFLLGAGGLWVFGPAGLVSAGGAEFAASGVRLSRWSARFSVPESHFRQMSQLRPEARGCAWPARFRLCSERASLAIPASGRFLARAREIA